MNTEGRCLEGLEVFLRPSSLNSHPDSRRLIPSRDNRRMSAVRAAVHRARSMASLYVRCWIESELLGPKECIKEVTASTDHVEDYLG